VEVKDHKGIKQLIDSETGYLESAHLEPETELGNAELESEQQPEQHNNYKDPDKSWGHTPYVAIEYNDKIQKLWEAHDSGQYPKTSAN
jgi:hypothetical protein